MTTRNHTIDTKAADEAIVCILANAQKSDTDRSKMSQNELKRQPHLVRRVNTLWKRQATIDIVEDAVDREIAETRPLRCRLAESDDLAEKYRLRRQIDAYRILPMQKAVPGAGNNLTEMPIASRRLRRKMEHDVRRDMSANDLIGNHGRIARHVLSASSFNQALADRHQRGLSKDIAPAVQQTLVADEVKEAA